MKTLNIGDSSEVWGLIQTLLHEIEPGDYIGGRPPKKSYESTIEGKELFGFSWDSVKCGKKMYLKFALKNDKFYYVSLHEDKPSEKVESKNGDKS